jgi:uncharacterized MAPEG superfamily protein
MTLELWMLLASAMLALFHPLIYGPGLIQQFGAEAMAGAREGLPEATGWAGRGLRAHRNLTENLLPFAVVVLVADAADVSNTITRIGAVVFLVMRVAYLGCYLGNVSYVRSFVFHLGSFGTLMVASQLL